MVGNGGLGNNVRREELVNIFSKYGSVVDVLLKPRKPYAFVTFSTVQESVRAFQDIHGRTMKCPEELSLPNVTFYLSFVKEGTQKQDIFSTLFLLFICSKRVCLHSIDASVMSLLISISRVACRLLDTEHRSVWMSSSLISMYHGCVL